MSYRREVETLLGKECMTKVLNHVRGGKMSDDQMRNFVEQLGELSEIDPNVLFGNHVRRMSRDMDRRLDTELLQVMYDWWENKLCEMTQDKALDILVRALSQPEVNCRHLANQLSHASTQVKHHNDGQLSMLIALFLGDSVACISNNLVVYLNSDILVSGVVEPI